MFLYWTNHPHGAIQCRDLVRRLYDDILKPCLDFDNMVVAISCPSILREIYLYEHL